MTAMEQPRLPPIALRPSRQLTFMLGAAHAAVLVLSGFLPLEWWIRSLLGALLMFSAMHSIYHHALRRSAGSVDTLEFLDRARLLVRTRDGRRHDAQVLGSSFVSVALIILNLGIAGRRFPLHVVIPGDSADAEELRRIRVWLRWGPQAPADAAELS